MANQQGDLQGSEINAQDIAATVTRAAQDLDQRIDHSFGDTFELLAEAFRTGAWRTLGYASWADYLATKADLASLRIPAAQRPEVFGRFRDAGMSNRQIAAAVGVSPPTVDRVFAATNVAVNDRDRINDAMVVVLSTLVDSLDEARDRRADIALGYPSWGAYVDAKFSQVPECDGFGLVNLARALRDVRNNRLHRARGFADFDGYCRERLPFITLGNIGLLIDVASIIDNAGDPR